MAHANIHNTLTRTNLQNMTNKGRYKLLMVSFLRVFFVLFELKNDKILRANFKEICIDYAIGLLSDIFGAISSR